MAVLGTAFLLAGCEREVSKTEDVKVKEAAALLAGLNISGTTMILTTGEDKTLYLAARNIPGVKVCRLENINVYDLLKYRNLLSDRDTLEKLQEVLK